MRGIREKIHQEYKRVDSLPTHSKSLRNARTGRFLRLLWRQNTLVFSVALLVFSVVSPTIMSKLSNQRAELTPEMRQLAGESRDDTKEHLSLSNDGSSYIFEVPEAETQGQSVHTGRVADAYSASLSTNPKDGITLTEKNSQIAVTLIPDFFTQAGQKVDGDHIVYPTGPDKLVYTLKYNGLKEDIIVPEYRADELTYKFTLRLPAGVEARLDDQGNIGIYSADPSLFGNISFGSDEDREKVEKARENGEKNHLIMTIPYPVIKDAQGEEHTAKAVFELGEKTQNHTTTTPTQDLPEEVMQQLTQQTTTNDYQLTLKAHTLKDLSYPIAIDPTMQVNTGNNFEGVEVQSGAEIDQANARIERSSLTGGELEGWVSATATTTTVGITFGSAVIGDYLVIMQNGGYDYINISADPDLNGSFTWVPHASGGATARKPIYYNKHWYWLSPDYVKYSTNKFVVGEGVAISGAIDDQMDERRAAAFAIYNNRLYVSGGCVDDPNILGNAGCANNSGKRFVSMIPINADGSITPGTWTHWNQGGDPQMATRRTNHDMTIVNGYIYVAGGCTEGTGGGYSCNSSGSSVNHNTVEYTKINEDGTLAGFVTATPTTPWYPAAAPNLFSHAGYLYIYRADNTSGANTGAVAFAQINADHTIGEWKETAELNLPRSYVSSTAVHNDRVYTFGGCYATGPCTNTNTAEYSDIAPAGEVGEPWTTQTNALTRGRSGASATVYNGYIYVAAGCTNCTNFLTYNGAQNVDYAPINPDGSIGAWMTSANWGNTGRALVKAQAYNGYLYVVGGYNHNSGTTYNTVIYAQINSDGSLGSWGTTGSIGTARKDFGMAIHNGIMYVVGGSSSPTSIRDTVAWAPINSDGTITATFTTESDLIPGGGRTRMDVEVWGDRMYMVGGCTSLNASSQCTGPINTVSYTDLLPSGGTSAWTDNPVGMDRNNYDYGNLMIIKGYLYVIGGQPSPYFNGVQFAKINNDGSVGDWVDSMQSLTFRIDPTSATDGTSLFFLGGAEGRSVSYTTKINNGGSGLATQAFQDAPTNATQRFDHSVATYGDYIYSSGGMDVVCGLGGCPANPTHPRLTSLSKGTIQPDGDINNWQNGILLPDSGRSNHALVQVNGYLFLIGGVSGSGGLSNKVFRAQINPADGSLGSWTELTGNSLNTGTARHAASVYGNKIILTGGYGTGGLPLDTTYYASVDENGNLSGWTPTTSLPQTRFHHTSVVVGDTLLVLGGQQNPSTVYNDVFAADIAGSGALSNWRTVGNLPSARKSHITAVANGFLYFGQGCSVGSLSVTACPSNVINDMWVTTVGVGGAIGQWVQTEALEAGGPNFGRSGASAITANGRLYVVGGCRGGCNETSDVMGSARYTGLASIPRIGHFSRYYDFGSGVRPTKLITRGHQQTNSRTIFSYINNNNAGNTWTNSVSNPSIKYGMDNMEDINLGTNTSLSRYFRVNYTIDDTTSAVFPDSGNESYITDFDLYFTSNPGSRLRGGRTFINGADRGLDAAPD